MIENIYYSEAKDFLEYSGLLDSDLDKEDATERDEENILELSMLIAAEVERALAEQSVIHAANTKLRIKNVLTNCRYLE